MAETSQGFPNHAGAPCQTASKRCHGENYRFFSPQRFGSSCLCKEHGTDVPLCPSAVRLGKQSRQLNRALITGVLFSWKRKLSR